MFRNVCHPNEIIPLTSDDRNPHQYCQIEKSIEYSKLAMYLEVNLTVILTAKYTGNILCSIYQFSSIRQH